ncbi:MAG: polyphosphate kinase 1 [Solirubrobacteraceae bacterium]
MTDARSAQFTPARDLGQPSLYFNRELSWLDFNDRVLQLAEDPALPLMERLKFLAIYTSNLDEFFMVRVAGVHEQIAAGVDKRAADGLSPRHVLEAITERVRALDRRHSHQFTDIIRPALAQLGIRLVSSDGSPAAKQELEKLFRQQIFPVLTPLAIGPERPFPYISNLSLSLLVHLHDPTRHTDVYARVKVPKEVLPRFVEIDTDTFIPLEDIIGSHLHLLFPAMQVVSHSLFRVTRDADFEVSDEADDLLAEVEKELRRRRFGEVVRLEFSADTPAAMRALLADWLELSDTQLYAQTGLLDLTDLRQIAGLSDHPELRQSDWTPVTHPALQPGPEDTTEQPNIFAQMREREFLVHYPYQSFTTSVERLVLQAAEDPQVLAIKATVYRTSDDSSLVPALIAAAEKGKQAVCMVELLARFDERKNIRWSRQLEEAGAHVVHSAPGLKTHAKVILVIRREHDGVRHYMMIGTGNFHAKNARLYEDYGFFTTDGELGQEVSDVFNSLTGYAQPDRGRRLLVAPNWMREPLTDLIDQTIAAHLAGQPARIRMKMNSLVDQDLIKALYRASQAGVPVELNVRGICCLRPGVPGVSETITVISVLGRFLEHARIYEFQAGNQQTVYIGSADMMPRNLDARVELLVPVGSLHLQAELADTLDRCLADDTSAWELYPTGEWRRRSGGTRSVQAELMARALSSVNTAPPAR